MVYADTDFFLALMKGSDWLKAPAMQILEAHRSDLTTSPAALIELLLLAAKYKRDPERLLLDVLEIATLVGGEPDPYLIAASIMNDTSVGVFDALQVAFCGSSAIISSDKVFDRLGLKRIPLR